MEKIEFDISEDDFIHVFGRKPTKKEYEDFCQQVKKAIEYNLDWGIIYQCVKAEMTYI